MFICLTFKKNPLNPICQNLLIPKYLEGMTAKGDFQDLSRDCLLFCQHT